MAVYKTKVKIRFAHCDPAVINVDAKIGTGIYIRTRAVLVCSKNDLSSSVSWPDDIAKNIRKFLI